MASDLENLIEKLKSNNSSEVCSALLKIKNVYMRNKCKMKKLLKYCIVKLIIQFLEHRKFRSISLNIIADCCLELSFVHEVIKYNGIQPLTQIMERRLKDDVQNQACRALGNLAKFDVGYKAIHMLKLPSRIISFLGRTSKVNCQQTAVRTLMILGKYPEMRELMVERNVAIPIALLLNSSNLNLLVCSIKAVANFTSDCSIFSVLQIVWLQLHEVIFKLSSHPRKSIKNHALIALKNLLMREETRSRLIKFGVVKLFTDILCQLDSHEMCCVAALALCSCLNHIHLWRDNEQAMGLKALLVVLQYKKFQDIHMHVISSLIPLCNESKVTDILLNLGVLQILIDILNDFIEKHKCKSKNSSLNSNFSLSEQTVQEASEFKADSSVQIEDYISGEGKKSPFSEGKGITADLNTSEIYYELETGHVKYRYFPLTDLKEMIPQVTSWSPVVAYVTCGSPVTSSRSNSPTPEPGILDNPYFEYDDIYDPLSSDDIGIDTSSLVRNNFPALPTFKTEDLVQNFLPESDMNKSTHITEVFDSKLNTELLKDVYSEFDDSLSLNTEINTSTVTSDCDEIQCLNSVQSNEISEKYTIDNYVLLFILNLFPHLEEDINSQLADKACFSSVIDYLCFIHNPCRRAETILLYLLQNPYYFKKLVDNGLISEMEDKMVSPNYVCSHESGVKLIYFNLMGTGTQGFQSNFAACVLANILATSEKNSQLHAICIISRFITNKSTLYRLLFEFNGLSLLCNFLSDSCIATCRKAVISVCELYQSLIKEEKKNCCRGICEMKTSAICFYKVSYHNVSFIVDGGVTILANREKLCENSEYFRLLLDGDFLESNVKAISLPEISAVNLSTIFHFLHGCGSGYCCPYIKRIPFAVLLELLCCCDRFILNDIKANVEDRLCNHLSPFTVSQIYRESKINNSPSLSKQCLNFVLKINTAQRDILWSCFEELSNLESDFNFLGDIESMLKSMF